MSGSELINAGRSEAGWSDIGPYMVCPQLWSYSRLLNISRPTSIYRIRGSLLHVGLAHHYAGAMHPDRFLTPAEAVHALASRENKLNTWATVDWRAPIEQVLNALTRHIADPVIDRAIKEVHGVELELRAPDILGTGPYTQRMDLWFEDWNGVFWIIDHKGAGRITKSTIRAFEMDGQMIGYQWLGREMWGDRFGGVLVSLVEWGDDQRLIRMPLQPAPGMIDRFPILVARARERRARDMETLDPHEFDRVMNSVGACYHRYGECEYAEDCKSGRRAA